MRIQNLASHPVSLASTALDATAVATTFLPHDQYLTSTAMTAIDGGAALIHGSAALINTALCFQANQARGGGGPYALRAWGELLKTGGYVSSGLGLNPLYGAAMVATGTLLTLSASAQDPLA